MKHLNKNHLNLALERIQHGTHNNARRGLCQLFHRRFGWRIAQEFHDLLDKVVDNIHNEFGLGFANYLEHPNYSDPKELRIQFLRHVIDNFKEYQPKPKEYTPFQI